MRLLGDTPIEQKVTLTSMLTTSLALLVCGGVLVVEEWFRGEEVGALSIVTAIMVVVALIAYPLAVRLRDAVREALHEGRDEIHEQILLASRLRGVAEIATNALHDVGNVLTSVNVSAGLVADSLETSKLSGLGRAAALLREHQHELESFLGSDPRGRNLPAYLAQLAEHLQEERRTTLAELELLRANVEHIEEIVATQQSHAKASRVKEPVNVADLVEDSLRMTAGASSRHGVEIARELAPVPMLDVDKHTVLQVLVNLVRNARHACDDSARPDKRITLRVTNGDGRVRVSVIDNGVGIAADDLSRIFDHGFTTRQLGHGFGLHSGALAARELGGSLTAHSAGVGRGAAFHLDLPLPSAGASS